MATVSKSISFGEDIYKDVLNYSNKYFQGNLSITVCYIMIKYFEDIENNRTNNNYTNYTPNKIVNDSISKINPEELNFLDM